MMAKKSFMDAFDLCWNAILTESKGFNNVVFNEIHCTPEETRDVNFDKVENRLAYMYKFGCFNILFVKKCVENFLENHPDAEKIFSRENLTICSLSNGPGLDIIGLLGAIYESSKHLKCFPVLKAINLYISWRNSYKIMLTNVYEKISTSCATSDIHNEIFPVIQSDIYSTIPPEAEVCIRASDILLMMKVFASTKATCDVVIKSMKEIFSLLKPGSFVFFVGSKKNTKELTAENSLNTFVNCILGPTKISVENLPVDEGVVKCMNVKAKQSGHAYFVIWQKKGTVSSEEVSPKKKRNRRKKNKSKVKEAQKELNNGIPVSSELTDDIDACSEVSFSSCSKQSEMSDEFKTTSCENVCKPVSPVETNREILNLVLEDQKLTQNELLHSINSITSLLDKFHMQPLNAKEENMKDMEENILEPRNESVCDLQRNIQEKELKSCVVKEEVAIQTENQGDSFNNISVKQIVNTESVLKGAQWDPESHLVKHMLPTKDNDAYLLDKGSMGHSCNEEKHMLAIQPNTVLSINENTHTPYLERNVQVKKVEMPIGSQANITCTPSKVKQTKNEELIASNFSKIKNSLVLKADICDETCKTDTISVKTSINKIYQANMPLPVIQNMNGEKVGSSEVMKVPKNKKKSQGNKKTSLPELNIENKKNVSKIVLGNQLHEKLIEFKRNITVKEEKAPEVNNKNKQNLNSLLQRCESLVTSLETLTANMKENLTLSNDKDSKHCIRESCVKFRHPYAGISSCVNTVHSNCYRKVYSCQMCKNGIYTTCSKNLPCRISVNEIHKCTLEAESSDVSRPHIVIPVQSKDILQILASKKF